MTADVIITGNSIALNPGEGFGDPMTVNFVPSTDRWTFDGGNYVEVPAVMPDVGQSLEMRLLDKAGAFAGASFTITTQAIDSATVEQVVPDRKITYNCQRE
ncbi:hypothetical protein SRABI121_02831 [Microbacterium sp. Bi121]|nr:hypothetical protein SRABI121_02831 [Microbacterium sp. Bi121]